MTDQTHLHTVEASDLAHKPMRYFDFVMAAFVAILLLSNVLGAGKVAKVNLPLIGDWPFGAGILFFPLGYLIGDILTEVYGYARARRCVPCLRRSLSSRPLSILMRSPISRRSVSSCVSPGPRRPIPPFWRSR